MARRSHGILLLKGRSATYPGYASVTRGTALLQRRCLSAKVAEVLATLQRLSRIQLYLVFRSVFRNHRRSRLRLAGFTRPTSLPAE